ncbi:MAG: FG-GAP-like repeat-containing protein [Marinoscillum sp.]|uniref:leucine-rich repeat domain-containing protein n=3 Tax=Marinoscillum sp. TaxID=2024838 RepID=UPI0033004C13
MMTKIITASFVVLSLFVNVFVLGAQEIRRATEAEISTYQEELSKKTKEHRTDLAKPSVNGTNVAQPTVAQPTPDTQEKTSAQKIEERVISENASKSLEYRELALERFIREFNQKKQRPMQDVGQPSFERVAPRSEEDLEEVNDEFLEDADLKALKLSIHQKNIEDQKRLIENGFGSANERTSVRNTKAAEIKPTNTKDDSWYQSLSGSSKSYEVTPEERIEELKQQSKERSRQRATVRNSRQAERIGFQADSTVTSDSLALVDFYYAMNGDFWYDNSNWLSGPVNTWVGVDWSSYEYEEVGDTSSTFKTVVYVTGLNLYDNNLSGILPTSIGDLDSLFYLSLGYNMITGDIPEEVGNLTRLDNLDLGGNFITSVPGSIGNLTDLGNISLWNRTYDDYGNFITDGITDLPASLWTLLNLYSLDLGGHQISALSGSVGNLTNLEYLYLWGNNLQSLPASVWNLSLLKILALGSNQITSIPTEIGNLSLLWELGLADNQLTDLPESIGNLDSLRYLYANDNQLTFIPSSIGNLTKLEHLGLWSNFLSNDISDFFGLSTLQSLVIYNNQLTGTLDGVSGLSNLYQLSIGSNQISGSIPAEIGSLTNLNYLWADNNQLSGSLPAELFELPAIIEIDLSSNQITGEFPVTTGTESLSYLRLAHNGITALSSGIGNFPNLNSLYIEFNEIAGNLPEELSADTALINFYAYRNQFTGTIPDSYSSLIHMSQIVLDDNLFDGVLPSAIGSWTELTIFSISRNGFVGAVPASMNNLMYMQELWIDNNQLTSLPDLSGLSSMYGFWGYNNYFEFDDFEPLMQTYASFNLEPQYTPEPTFEIVSEGTEVLIDATIGGSTNHYQWYFNGEWLDAGDTSVLVIPSLSNSTAGTYWCEIYNDSVTNQTGLHLYSGDRTYWISAPVTESDSLALVDIYKATRGRDWYNANNWLKAPVAMWEGVFLKDGRVTKLDLYDKNLQRGLPPSIGDLDALEWLSLYYNPGLRSIPGELYTLTNLHYLDLDITGIDKISPSIGLLTNLDTLWIGGNNYETKIPAELFSLTKLKTLEMAGAGFRGTIPDEIGSLTELEALWLSNMPKIRGDIPASMSSLSKLAYLNISGTPFTGGLENIAGVTSLTSLYLYNSPLALTTLPSSLSALTNLESLNMSGGDFSAGLPAVIWEFSQLKRLTLAYMQLTEVPTELSGVSLEYLNIGNNSITGGLPADMKVDQLKYIYFQNNDIDDISVLENAGLLETLIGYNNRLDFADLIPLIPYFENNQQFDVGYQQSLPVSSEYVQLSVGESLNLTVDISADSITYIDWYQNGSYVGSGSTFTIDSVTNPNSDGYYEAYLYHDVISPLVGLQLYNTPVDVQVVETVLAADSTALVSFYNAISNSSDQLYNWLEGPVETWYGVEAYGGRVQGLSLYGLEGTISGTGLGSLDALTFLQLYGGNLEGGIPVEIFSLPNLGFIDLGNNRLTGSIPSEIGNASQLGFIGFSGNFLSGSIPSEIGQIPNVYELFLDNNRLTGAVPESFNQVQWGALGLDRNHLTDLPSGLDTALMYAYHVNFEYNQFDYEDLARGSGNAVYSDYSYAPQESTREIYFTGDATVGGTVTLHAERQDPNDEFYWYRARKGDYEPFYDEFGYTGTDSTYTFTIDSEWDQTKYMAVVRNSGYKNGDYRFLSTQLVVDPFKKRFASSMSAIPIDISSLGSDLGGVGTPDTPPIMDGDGWEWWLYDSWWHNAIEPDLDTLKMYYTDSAIAINYVRLHSPGGELNVTTMTLYGAGGEKIEVPVYREIYGYENQLKFPKTSFAVNQIDFAVTNGSVDAIEIGDTGSDEIDPPVLSDFYTEIGRDYLYVEVINPGFADYIVLERGTDGVNFDVIDTIGYTGWYYDEVSPGTYHYRAKAGYTAFGAESGYSNVLKTGNCEPVIPLDKVWAGISTGLGDYEGITSTRDSVFIYESWSYGSFNVSDISAGWYDQFWGYHEELGFFREKCDNVVGYSQYGQIPEVNATYENDTLYLEWKDFGFNFHVISKFYVIGDAPENELYELYEPENVTAYLISSSSIGLTWDTSDGSNEFIVQRSEGDATNFVNVDTVINQQKYADVNTLDGRHYYYRVIAKAGNLISYPSEEANIIHKAALFEPVSNAVTEDITRTSYGGAWADFDGDGDDDLYVTNAFDLAANFLYENTGNGTFKKIIGTIATTEIGFTRSSSWGDYDNDGFTDLFVPFNGEGDRIYRNTGSKSFVKTNTAVATATLDYRSEAGAWVDLDNDGNLDLVTSAGFVFTNDGAGALTLSATLESQDGLLPELPILIWTVSNVDFDNDGDQDIYFTGDQQNMFFVNDGTGQLSYVENTISNDFVRGRGYTWADFNNDGFLDLMTGDRNVEALGLYLNDQNGDFEFLHITAISNDYDGNDNVRFGRGYTSGDMNNDGWQDLVWTIEDRAYILYNAGNLTFDLVDVDEQAFPETNLFSHISLADINGDGALDIFLPNQDFNGHNFIYVNNVKTNNWISVKLKGIESNRSGIGGRVRVKANNAWQVQAVTSQNGISSGNSLRTEFGVGTATVIDSIAVDWPSGLTTYALNVTPNKFMTMVEVPVASGPTVNEDDSTALVALYNATAGANWIKREGWLEGSPLAWEGANFDDNGRLVSLILNDNNLVGAIPTEITNLTSLEVLDLSGNQLTGKIPEALGNMTTLYNLSLNDNQLQGTIPASVGSLVNLQNLDLYNNNFLGELPATLGSLSELRQFEIHNNGFIGFVPETIGTLTNLQVLRLDNNDFEGPLPEGLGGMASLQVLYVNDNHFTESLPASLGGLSELLQLKVQNNEFSGDLPASLSALTGIQYIDISNNLFSGSLSPLAELDTIYYLNADKNRFTALPDFASNSADTIFVRNNSLDFEGFELNASLIQGGRLLVNPQDSLFARVDSLHNVGVGIEIFFEIGGASNTYTWKFNGEVLESSTGVDVFESSVLIASPDTPNEGEYILEITNESFPDVKLVTRPFNLKLSSLERDRRALLAFKDAVDQGAFKFNLTTWTGDLTSSWEGVTVEDNRVTALSLPAEIDTDLTDGDQSRILEGSVPASFADLSGLVTLDLKGNYLRSFQNISKWPSITSVDISNNRLAFKDIIPNLGLTSTATFNYVPQRRYDETVYDTIQAGENLQLGIQMSGTGLQYQWKFGAYIPGQPYNNDVANITGANSRVLQIESIDYSKMGTYRVEVTHPQVPDLTITSRNKNIMASTDIFGTVFADNSNTLLTDGQVIIYRRTPAGPFVAEDTTEVDATGLYGFSNVVLGDFIALARPVRSIFPNTIPTYYEQAELYRDATTIEVRERIEGVDIQMIFYQEPDVKETGADFVGELFTDIEDEGIVDEEGSRVNARRKVKRAACSMRRFVRSGRGIQEDIYELYAYVESDDEGRFNFEGVEEGKYLLNIEYPGVPMDPSSDIEFIVGGDKENQLFTLTAVITENGIEVEATEVLYSLKPYIKNVKLYPNPTENILTADFLVYRKLNDLKLEVVDVKGVKLWEQELNPKMGAQNTRVDLTTYPTGVYFIVFTDEAGTFRQQVKIGKK